MWGFPRLLVGWRRHLPLLAFFLFHSSYVGWHGGTGFSARYLVPALPAATLAVKEQDPRGWLFRLALSWGVLWGVTGGLFPALVYDRSPWGIVQHVLVALP